MPPVSAAGIRPALSSSCNQTGESRHAAISLTYGFHLSKEDAFVGSQNPLFCHYHEDGNPGNPNHSGLPLEFILNEVEGRVWRPLERLTNALRIHMKSLSGC